MPRLKPIYRDWAGPADGGGVSVKVMLSPRGCRRFHHQAAENGAPWISACLTGPTLQRDSRDERRV